MNNIIKHSGANEVFMEMVYQKDMVSYILRDNGMWKDADEEVGTLWVKKYRAQGGEIVIFISARKE